MQYLAPLVPDSPVQPAYAQVGSHPNLFVSAENPQYDNYFAGPQVIQVVVSDPSINRLDEHYGEPVVTIDGKRLRMAQATDGNWYGYFADRNQAIIASDTAPLQGKGMNFGALCGKGMIGGLDFTQAKGFAMARGNSSDGMGLSLTGTKVPVGPLTNTCASPYPGTGKLAEHVVRQAKPLNTNPSGYGAPQGLVNAWPVIQLYDFSLTSAVVVDYQASSGDQTVSLTFDRIPSSLISAFSAKKSYTNGDQALLSIDDPQLNIDPTDADSWTWGSSPKNNTLYYEAFDANGERDADGTAAMQNLAGNLTDMMFGHNGLLVVNPFSGGSLVLDFQSDGKQMLNNSKSARGDPTKMSTESLSPGSEPITFTEGGGVGSGIFVNWGPLLLSDVSISDTLNSRYSQAAFSYNGVQETINANPGQYTILFRSGGYTPPNTTSGISSYQMGTLSTERVHLLVQFSSIPSQAEIDSLARQGITLTQYVTGNAYIASSVGANVGALSYDQGIRWVGPLPVATKISPLLGTGNPKNFPSWAFAVPPNQLIKSITNRDVLLTIQLQRDADVGALAQEIANYGGTIRSEVPLIPAITASFHPTNLTTTVSNIAGLDGVQFVDLVDPPFVEQNDKARAGANIDYLQQQENAGNGVTGLLGDGVNVFLYDGGVVYHHPDFDNRISYIGGSCNETHATEVAGLLGGSGKNSNSPELCDPGNPGQSYCNGSYMEWEGMAPHVNIVSDGYDKLEFSPESNSCYPSLYNDENNFTNDYGSIYGRNIDLASMSIASDVEPACCLDNYTLSSRVIDNMTTGMVSGQDLPIFEAAGNYNPLSPTGFGTVDPPATAKNSIAVGALNAANFTVLDSSSFGPTHDGRIKPDITAPGCFVNSTGSTFISTDWDVGDGRADYESGCGTSEATPVAAGAAALLVEKWHELHGRSPALLPGTIKAIFVHTALDVGSPGPSYKYGWGVLDAKAAVKLVDDDAAMQQARLINVGSIAQGQTVAFGFDSNSSENVKATLVWDDPPPSPLANEALVNQLNLTLLSPNGTRILPYLLNPAEPEEAATRGNDTINNVLMAEGNASGGRWQAVVTGSQVTGGTQGFTLIISNDYKRQVGMSLTPQTYTGTGATTVNATIWDGDNGTRLAVSGGVAFSDGGDGGTFSSRGCHSQDGALVCLADYMPGGHGMAYLAANYTGDLVHSKFFMGSSSDRMEIVHRTANCTAVTSYSQLGALPQLQALAGTPNLVSSFLSGGAVKITGGDGRTQITNYVTLQDAPDNYGAAFDGITGQNITTVAFPDSYWGQGSSEGLGIFLQISHTGQTINSMRGASLGPDGVLVGISGAGPATVLANSAPIAIPDAVPTGVSSKARDPLNASTDSEPVPAPVLEFLNNDLELKNEEGGYLTNYYLIQTVPDLYTNMCDGISGQNVTTVAFEDRYGQQGNNGNPDVLLQFWHSSTRVNSLRGIQLGGNDIDVVVNGVDNGNLAKAGEIPVWPGQKGQ